MRKLLKRWYVWLGLVLLLGLAGSVALICSRQSRITQASFDRIQDGMSQEEVEAILASPGRVLGTTIGDDGLRIIFSWGDGPNSIHVLFRNGKSLYRTVHIATVRETLQWYAKKGAAKIGVKWD
jgi:hypothetical protein